MLQSVAHASPRDAGQLVARLKGAAGAIVAGEDRGVQLDGADVGRLAEADVTLQDVSAALAAFAADEG